MTKEYAPRPKVAKGKKPYFFDDPSVDKVLSITMALAGEVSMLRDRIDTHEALAKDKLWPTQKNIEAFEITEEVEVARDERRSAYLERVFRVVLEELERAKAG